jgi:hypothetical protein
MTSAGKLAETAHPRQVLKRFLAGTRRASAFAPSATVPNRASLSVYATSINRPDRCFAASSERLAFSRGTLATILARLIITASPSSRESRVVRNCPAHARAHYQSSAWLRRVSYRSCRPFRIVTGAEDLLINLYEGECVVACNLFDDGLIRAFAIVQVRLSNS